MTTPELIAECRALLMRPVQSKRTHAALTQVIQRLTYYHDSHNTAHAFTEVGAHWDTATKQTTKIFQCPKCGEIRRVTY